MTIIDLKTLYIIIVLYISIGVLINKITEPHLHGVPFSKYQFANWFTLFVDLFLWPLEVFAYYVIIPVIKYFKNK